MLTQPHPVGPDRALQRLHPSLSIGVAKKHPLETLDLVRRRASRHVTPEHRHDSLLALYGECEFAPAIYGGDAFRCDDEHHSDSGVDGLADLIPEALAAEQPFDVKPESQFVGRETRLQLPDECQFL